MIPKIEAKSIKINIIDIDRIDLIFFIIEKDLKDSFLLKYKKDLR